MKAVQEAKIKSGQVVILRSDFDSPLTWENEIADDFRLKAALPTIKLLLKKKAKIILLSHLGRPQGKVVKEARLAPIAEWLEKHLVKVEYFGEFRDFEKLRKKIERSALSVFLLENLRFYPEEENNDFEFAQKLASLGSIFVNDAFAVSHRCHASIVSLPQLLPTFFGLRFQEETSRLNQALKAGQDLVVVLGGAKTKTKIPLIKDLVKKKAVLLLGGLIGNTFLAAFLKKKTLDGEPIIEKERQMATDFLMTLDKQINFAGLPGKTTQIWLPLDLWVAGPDDKKLKLIDFSDQITDSLPADKQVYGLGPKTLREYTGLIAQAKAVILNGPLNRPHPLAGDPQSTAILGKAIVQSHAFSLVGGGDTVAALAKAQLLGKIDYISTGGGAMLYYLAKGTLPGIEATGKNNQII